MIAAFGLAEETTPGNLKIEADQICGVHLTLLRPDGSGKADVQPNKLMIGPSAGAPIVLAPPGDGLSLAITEGIEEGLSLHVATGLGVWAAGCASRLPALAKIIPAYIECVPVVVDDDNAGRQYSTALRSALRARGFDAPHIAAPRR
jgi:Toprim domain